MRDFLDRRLDSFGPLGDAVVADAPHLWHSVPSRASYCDVGGPLNSHEEFLRQVCGWRGYACAPCWLRMPAWRTTCWTGAVAFARSTGTAAWHCLASTVRDLQEWVGPTTSGA